MLRPDHHKEARPMPGMEFDLTPTDAVFDEDDPLTITIPGAPSSTKGSPAAGGTFTCKDRWNPDVEDDDHDLRTRPVSTLFQMLTSQVVDEEQEAFEAALVVAWETVRIDTDSVIKMVQNLNTARTEAAKKRLAGKVDRPTKARARSTR